MRIYKKENRSVFRFADEILEKEDNMEVWAINKNAAGYLIYLSGCCWDGSSGYKLIDHPISSMDAVLYRGYECSISYIKQSKRMKYLRTRESSHDRPMGYIGHILALSDSELARARTIFKKYPCGSDRFNLGIQRLFMGYLD